MINVGAIFKSWNTLVKHYARCPSMNNMCRTFEYLSIQWKGRKLKTCLFCVFPPKYFVLWMSCHNLQVYIMMADLKGVKFNESVPHSNDSMLTIVMKTSSTSRMTLGWKIPHQCSEFCGKLPYRSYIFWCLIQSW